MEGSFSSKDLGLDELIEKFNELKNKVKDGSKTVDEANKNMKNSTDNYTKSLTDVNKKIDKLTSDIIGYKKRQDELKQSVKKGMISETQYNREIAEVSHSLSRATNDRKNYINVIQSEEGSVKRAKAENALWRRERNELGKATSKNKNQINQYNKAIDKNTKIIGDNVDKQSKYHMGINEATGALGQFVPGVGQASSAAKTFGTILKVALGPIGLIIAAIGALTAYFKRSEEGQNSFNKVIAVFKVVLNNVLDVIGKVGEALFNAVEKPKEAWQKFKDFVKGVGEFFKNTFGNVIGGSIEIFVGFMQKAFAKVGLAWQKFKDIFVDNTDKVNKAQEKIDKFNQKIEDGQERVKEGAENLGDGIKNAFDKAKTSLQGFIAEQQKEIDIAKRLADQQAALDKQIRKNLVDEAEARRDLEKLKADVEEKNKLTAEERLRLLDAENKIYDKILANNLDILQQKLSLKKEQNELSASRKEDLDEEARLQADIYNLEASITSQRKEAITKRIELENTIREEERKSAEESLRIFEEELARKDEVRKLDYDNQLEIAQDNIFKVLDLEREGLEMKRQQEVEYAEKIGADVELVNKKYAKANEEIARAERDAKLALAGGFAENLAQIFGEQTAVGKAAAIASTTISTYQSATSSYAALAPIPIVGPVLGAAAAIAAIANGLANVKKILSVKSGLPGESLVSAAPVSGGSSSQSAPVVSNVNPEIGKGIVSRQLSETGIQQTQEYKTAVIIDQVTANQNIKSQQEKTAIL